jgi:small subunit ribosomal protein S3Ae
VSPGSFGEVELGEIPADDSEKVLGRIVEVTLYDITEDFSHQYMKMRFQMVNVEGKKAITMFKGHEYSRDYLRSLVRRRTSRIDGIFNVKTKDGYGLTVSVCAFTLQMVNTSQETDIRMLMRQIVAKKASELTFDQFVQEMVLGKIASDIYNEAKKISPLRHVGIRKSKLTEQPPKVAA